MVTYFDNILFFECGNYIITNFRKQRKAALQIIYVI